MTLEDKTLTCMECGTPFTFTAGEQEFFASRGYVNEPKRCPECRGARRAQQRGYGEAPREMHQTVCAQCGGEALVPFVPRGGRPVYCNDCCSAMRSSEPN